MTPELTVPFEHLERLRAATRRRKFSNEWETVWLHRIGGFEWRIHVAHRLRCSGLGLKAAHTAISELAEKDWTLCEIPVDGGLEDLARDLKPLDVQLYRGRTFPEPGTFMAAVRACYEISQPEIADALGVDIDTVQNWEQGRNRTDSAFLSLIALFDRGPALVREIAFEPLA